MLHRLQSGARRWPRLCLALVLVAFSSQSVAVALDWCLDAVGGTHVGNVFAPCGERHGQHAGVGAAGTQSLPSADSATTGHPDEAAEQPAPASHCHGDGQHGAPGHAMHHVAATSDAASSLAATIVALPVAACWQFLTRAAMLETTGAGMARPCRAATALESPRPRLSGAIPGESSRLLI